MGEAATGRWRADSEGPSERHAVRPARVLRRWGRLTLASGLVLLAGPTLAPAAQAAPQITVTGLQPAAATARTASAPAYDASAPVGVTLATVNPPVPSPDGSVTLSGSVTNRSSNAISNLHVGLLTTGVPVSTRSQIEELADPTLHPQGSDGREIDLPALQAKIGTLAAHATVPFTITAPVAKLVGSSPDGVYALGVAALTGSAGFQGHTLGIARTFLPLRDKNSSDKSVKTATLWPLTDNPRVQAQTYVDSSHLEEPVLTDDDLTGSLRPEGRLGQLASIGATNNTALHLTWMIDPDLIDTVYAMTGNYQVVTGDGDASGANAACNCVKKGTGSDVATAWLKGLQTSLGAQNRPDVVSLPYADPDIAALAHNPKSLQALGPVLTATSSSLGLDRLQVDAAHNVAWPYQGYLDNSITKLAKSMGATQIIANGASMPDSENLNYTPNAARSIGGGMTAVVADGALTDIFAGNLSSQSAQTAAIQQFLAETLKISEERPGTQRTVVVQPPRQMSTATAQTLIKALKDAQGGQWLTTTDLNGVVAAGATSGANTHVPNGYPSNLRNSEPSEQLAEPLSETRSNLDQLQQILTRPDRLREPFGAAMARSSSTAWRNQPSAGYAYSSSMMYYSNNLVGSVKILKKSNDVVVPGGNSSAQIAVTVENDLEQTVTNLRLELVTTEATPRLHIDSASVQDVTIAGGRTKTTYRFKVSSTANGSVQMTAKLYSTQDPSAAPFSTQTFTVNITSVSTGVIAVVAGGVLLVVLAGLRLYWKRKKNAALEAAGGPGPEGGSEGGHEGDAADTGATADAESPAAAESADPVENEEKQRP